MVTTFSANTFIKGYVRMRTICKSKVLFVEFVEIMNTYTRKYDFMELFSYLRHNRCKVFLYISFMELSLDILKECSSSNG